MVHETDGASEAVFRKLRILQQKGASARFLHCSEPH
jgi:hypothetical protein